MGTETGSERAHKSWNQGLMLGWSEPSCTNGIAGPQAMADGPELYFHLFTARSCWFLLKVQAGAAVTSSGG